MPSGQEQRAKSPGIKSVDCHVEATSCELLQGQTEGHRVQDKGCTFAPEVLSRREVYRTMAWEPREVASSLTPGVLGQGPSDLVDLNTEALRGQAVG